LSWLKLNKDTDLHVADDRVIEQQEALNKPKEPMGEWLVRNMANLGELELPERTEPPQGILVNCETNCCEIAGS
jgi:hypothetical protein